MSLKIIHNLKGIVSPLSTLNYGELDIRDNMAIVIKEDRIKTIVKESEAGQLYPEAEFVNGRNCWAFPGFVDPHTHPVFYHTRETEFEMRIKGKSYEEIAAAGGGIRNSVRMFRTAADDELTRLTWQRINNFSRFGITTIEAKSGYGLTLEDELKSLRILKKLKDLVTVSIVPTFLGAHEVPDEFQDNREGYIDLIIREMIPAVVREKLAVFCDVFTEKNVFSIEESERILLAAKNWGLIPKLHADELYPLGGAELAAKIRAISADHLCKISDAGIDDIRSSGVVPVLLPGTTFFLGKKEYAPARKMIDSGLPVALATDFNPGSSFTQNIFVIMSLAAIQLKMSMPEIIWSVTLTAAGAVGKEKEIGSLEPGKKADLALLDVPNYKFLAYNYGENPVRQVIRSGEVVYTVE